MDDKEKIKIISKSILNFDYFIHNIFSQSYKQFITGQHIHNTAELLQYNRWTMRISARDHFKSTSLYANWMWKILRTRNVNREGHYFSFNQSMAGYHINKMKDLIRANPFFSSLMDFKPTAENVMKYSWDGAHFITLEPHGLLQFKRGLHAHDIYVDDPFQDPENKLNPNKILKINKIISTEILAMVMQGGELHIAGTAQTNTDFFFDQNFGKSFAVRILPAIQDEINKKVLFPEWMSYEELCKRRDMSGERIFNQEYQCVPVTVENSFFKEPQIMACIDRNLKNMNTRKTPNDIYLGWDIGGKVHPSYIAVIEVLPSGKMIQLHSEFINPNIGYPLYKQLLHVNNLCNDLNVTAGMFDNTREELKTSIETGKVDRRLIPFVFSEKSKRTLSEDFDEVVSKKTIGLLNDARMIRQILVVDNNLQAWETPDGHGDAFWGLALAIHCAKRKEAHQSGVMFDEEGIIF